ncbi:hypothetical protein VN12_26355 [Pirellula sp. SH-Sr6A]|uniref:hypothetical protein n=1 Tax=Pirellula sp. SH-Sr6A TaxID=1632865 RepID=UPI00078E7AD9|nr:hypothetical protein [Pirellula sp. SH-Sr6A]AMV35642.1 hypothetical protein VN12_26355 [Pirellula sp. SH-Sr6A]
MASLAFTDNQDGTGGVFVVTGSAVGDNHTVFVSRFMGSNTDRSFAPVGSRAGNGSVAFAGVVGCYIAHLATINGTDVAFTTPSVFRITNGAVSLYERVLEAVREFVLSLGLPGVPADPSSHQIAKVGAKLKDMLRGSDECVFYIPTAEEISGEDNSFISVEYTVNVIFYLKGSNSLRGKLSELLVAREDLFNSIESVPLPDVPEIHTVKAKPGAVTDHNAWGQGMDVSFMTFTAVGEQKDGML